MKKGEKVLLSEDEWRRRLTPEQFHILREKGTESAFTGKHFPLGKKGVYVCAGCGASLFSSEKKFESGTGWPSFWAPLEGGVEKKPDSGLFMKRTEVLCRRCSGHLGHVFPDGPEPTGMRYCMNAVALDFKEENKETRKKVRQMRK